MLPKRKGSYQLRAVARYFVMERDPKGARPSDGRSVEVPTQILEIKIKGNN